MDRLEESKSFICGLIDVVRIKCQGHYPKIDDVFDASLMLAKIVDFDEDRAKSCSQEAHAIIRKRLIDHMEY